MLGHGRDARADLVALALVSTCIGSGCTPRVTEPPSCEELGVAIEPSGPAERRVLGAAAQYEADPTLAARMEELSSSQRARRAVAWAAIARVLAPTSLAETTPLAGARVPAFRTWYDRDDLNAMFQHAYEGIGRDRRVARDAFTSIELDETLAWNVRAVDEIAGWTPERFETYVAGLHTQPSIDGLGGFRRVAVSPDAARHLLASYDELTTCLDGERPAPFVDGPPSAQLVAHTALALTRCHETVSGPFFAAGGSRLVTHVESPQASDARVSIRASVDGLVGDASLCERAATTDCEVTGPGAFFVVVRADAEDVSGSLEVSLEEPERVAPGCLAGMFPLGAATVAAHWERADQGFPLPTFDTSASGLRRRFDDGSYTWGAGDGEADPGPDAIYTVTIPAGPTYRLAGLHIRTRELEHWLNITLWWSPDPDTDFGADRAPEVVALGAPWSSYKMCVAIDFEELDDDPGGGFADVAPTLAASLAEVHDDASWCSNPYIDAAPGLLRGNCVGCHQHAMGERAPGEIALDEDRFPNGGRSRARNNEPADGFWSVEIGDDVGVVLRDTIAAWAAVD